MLRLGFIVALWLHTLLHRYAPSNRLIRRLQRQHPRNAEWRISLYAVPFFGAACLLWVLIDAGAPTWLYAVAGILIWDAGKFLTYGPATFLRRRLTRARDALRTRSTVQR
ncbi:hypothetical protein [Leucobacter ruminantium]|uniref:Uncharacterized protein n=1 Tax=Leucobacter ruminantium TaxID=1289170 RepID=A0A939LXK3_9MICO|nr:hypothetical protein [Leucobacter ruminantium]MBO1806629.1 hypothetical protein [Leucobacter ruminantium]